MERTRRKSLSPDIIRVTSSAGFFFCSKRRAKSMLPKKNPAELVTLIISGDKLFLRVRSIKVHAGRQQREIAHEIDPQIEHFRPKIGDLLVTDALLARHISPCYQTLFAGVLPVGLTPHAAHDPVRVEGEIADGVNSFFLGLEIFGDRRPVRPR